MDMYNENINKEDVDKAYGQSGDISDELYEALQSDKESTHVRRPKVTKERPDGSSDGLYEALDIDLGDGYKACSNREHFDQIGSLEDLFPEVDELTAEQLIEEYRKSVESNKNLE